MQLIIAVVLIGMACISQVLADEGLDFPETKHVNGTQLIRNGTGVRSLSLFGMPIKVYVAGFYTLAPLRSWEAVQECSGPKHMEFTFLRSVGQSQVKQAWHRQLEHSVTHIYEGYEEDRDTFVNLFGPIPSGGTTQIQLLGEDTVVVDQDRHKGIIRGKDFQRAFLTMWFGEKAVQASLKDGLLGGGAPEAAAALG